MSTLNTPKEIGFTVTFGGQSLVILYTVLSVLYIVPVSNPVQNLSWTWVVAPMVIYLAIQALWKVAMFFVKRVAVRNAQIAEMRKNFDSSLDRVVGGH